MLEAMAFALPIVSTNVNGIPEAIYHNENGLLLPAGAPLRLAEALEEMLINSEKRQRLASCARAYAIDRFSQTQFKERFSELYRQAEDWL